MPEPNLPPSVPNGFAGIIENPWEKDRIRPVRCSSSTRTSIVGHNTLEHGNLLRTCDSNMLSICAGLVPVVVQNGSWDFQQCALRPVECRVCDMLARG